MTISVSHLSEVLDKLYQAIRVRPCIDCYSDNESCGCNCGCLACFKIPSESRRSEGVNILLFLLCLVALLLLAFVLGYLIYQALTPAATHSP
jgi:hypothetical protein